VKKQAGQRSCGGVEGWSWGPAVGRCGPSVNQGRQQGGSNPIELVDQQAAVTMSSSRGTAAIAAALPKQLRHITAQQGGIPRSCPSAGGGWRSEVDRRPHRPFLPGRVPAIRAPSPLQGRQAPGGPDSSADGVAGSAAADSPPRGPQVGKPGAVHALETGSWPGFRPLDNIFPDSRHRH